MRTTIPSAKPMGYSALLSLVELGAGRVSHIHADLADHLLSTHDRLCRWGNGTSLCLAGLFHAVYGTFGFAHKLVEIDDRPLVVEIIGQDAEEIVYIYAACDRARTYPQICRSDAPVFHDRFTESTFVPSTSQLKSFAELTIANEIDVAAPDPGAYLAAYGKYVLPLFRNRRFQTLISEQARIECQRYFGPMIAS